MYEDFVEVVPDCSKRSGYGVSILEDGKININGKLRNEIGDRNIRFKYGNRGKGIVIMLCNNKEGFKLNKAGVFRCSKLIDDFKQYKLIFPIHYDVQLNEDFFFGETSDNYNKSLMKK